MSLQFDGRQQNSRLIVAVLSHDFLRCSYVCVIAGQIHGVSMLHTAGMRLPLCTVGNSVIGDFNHTENLSANIAEKYPSLYLGDSCENQ